MSRYVYFDENGKEHHYVPRYVEGEEEEWAALREALFRLLDVIEAKKHAHDNDKKSPEGTINADRTENPRVKE